MSALQYRDTRQFAEGDLGELFLSVQWSSGRYPHRLVRAMAGSDTVYSAWDGDTLVGLVNALDDGEMTAYIHYLLVRPAYQGRGVGRALLEKIKERYRDYLRLVLISYDAQNDFYRHCGFQVGDGKTPLFLTSLTT